MLPSSAANAIQSRLTHLSLLPLFSLTYKPGAKHSLVKKASSPTLSNHQPAKHSAAKPKLPCPVNSSTTATSLRDQTAVLFFPPFGTFFVSFLVKQERK
jgi:hypothetical protein